MKKTLILMSLTVVLALSGCVAYVEPTSYDQPGPGVVVAPALPNEVILESRPFYSYGGYYYYYDSGHNYWLYSHARKGPWYQLPRSHYPRRYQYRGKWYGEGRDHDRDRDYERDHERDHEGDHDRDHDMAPDHRGGY